VRPVRAPGARLREPDPVVLLHDLRRHVPDVRQDRRDGPNTHPVYEHLKSEAPGLLGTTSVKWNFTKFLVDRSGKVVKRYASTDTPKKIEADVKELL
jgi:glutathione peroxidase-family protein